MTSQAVSPRSVKVSEEVEGGDSVNEGASESNDEEQRALQEFDLDFERDSASCTPTSEEIQEHFGHIFIGGAGARTACLDVE